MAAKEAGYVYILTNPSFKEDWVKIGKSSRPVDVRSKELDNTAVPLPFEIFATLKTTKYNEVERLVHKTIDRLTDLRIRQNREFFNVAPQMALDILRDIATTLDDAEIIEYESNQPINPETDTVEGTVRVGTSDTSKMQLEFWTEFNAQAINHSSFIKEFSLRKANPQHWYDISVGSSEYFISMTASRQKHELTAGIYIPSNKGLFESLKAQSTNLESDLGCTLEWREASKACRFIIHKSFDMDDRTKWQEAITWLYNMSIKIKNVLRKYV